MCPDHQTVGAVVPPSGTCARRAVLHAWRYIGHWGAFVNRAVTCPAHRAGHPPLLSSPITLLAPIRRDFAVDKRRGSSVQYEALRSSDVVTPVHAVRGPEGEP